MNYETQFETNRDIGGDLSDRNLFFQLNDPNREPLLGQDVEVAFMPEFQKRVLGLVHQTSLEQKKLELEIEIESFFQKESYTAEDLRNLMIKAESVFSKLPMSPMQLEKLQSTLLWPSETALSDLKRNLIVGIDVFCEKRFPPDQKGYYLNDLSAEMADVEAINDTLLRIFGSAMSSTLVQNRNELRIAKQRLNQEQEIEEVSNFSDDETWNYVTDKMPKIMTKKEEWSHLMTEKDKLFQLVTEAKSFPNQNGEQFALNTYHLLANLAQQCSLLQQEVSILCQNEKDKNPALKIAFNKIHESMAGEFATIVTVSNGYKMSVQRERIVASIRPRLEAFTRRFQHHRLLPFDGLKALHEEGKEIYIYLNNQPETRRLFKMGGQSLITRFQNAFFLLSDYYQQAEEKNRQKSGLLGRVFGRFFNR